MINIRLKVKDGKYDIKVRGHAMYNPGNDIVCAAVSCLVYTFLGYLKNRDDVSCDYDMDKGYSRIEAEGDIHEAYEMFRIGLLQIERKYPDNVRVLTF